MMKTATQSMDPHEAAQAFFGQDDASFAEMLTQLTANDPRLTAVFQRTRQRFLDKQND
ncbi:hypothetical protein [Roseobacter sp. CCS2]|uniref:hypothetical protein n=1 Tax=Roseobacter sp. CCS2 TaxID=391593 RepID=UPI0000F3E190|nr:hypothetical protein [Roseobacter sp. CCS2]EBA11952.1 hypothetical protein RCCS2_11684 [Roseobacter sp. CCS2]